MGESRDEQHFQMSDSDDMAGTFSLDLTDENQDCRPFKYHPTSQITSTNEVRQHYEIMSLPYRVFWGEHLHHGLFLTGRESPRQAQLQLLEYASRVASIRPGARVLDVGCGYGATAIYLARNFRCRVDGATLSPKQARIAQRKIARAGLCDQVRVVVCDVERFDLQSKYDLIWMMESSEHFQDKASYMKRATNLLHEGGKFIIAAWTGSHKAPLVQEIADLTVCPGFQTADEYELQLRAAIRRFLRAIPLMMNAYRDHVMSYTLIVAQKEPFATPFRSLTPPCDSSCCA